MARALPMLLGGGALLLHCAGSSPLAGGPSETLTIPDDADAGLLGLSLRGHKRHRAWGLVDVYDASLWTPHGFQGEESTESHLLALELRYLKTIPAALIAARAIQEMRRSGPLASEQERWWMEEMLRVFPKQVHPGDRLLGLQLPGKASLFWHNGLLCGEVRDAEFTRRFFGIWLHQGTSEPELRRALLGAPARRTWWGAD